MTKLILNTDNPAQMVTSLGEYFRGLQLALHKTADKLPPNLKADFDTIKTQVDQALTQMASRPTDQIPAAERASYALECMARSMINMQEISDNANSMIDRILKEYGPKDAELMSLKGQIEKKELVTKAEMDAAVEKATKAEQDRFAMFATRRGDLMKAELPAPATDELLNGDDKEWGKRLEEAKNRKVALKDFGGFEQMTAERRVKLLLGEKDRFDEFREALDLMGKGGATGEPLAGAGGKEKDKGGEGKDKENKEKRRLAF
jgi:hypothetical protein